MHDRGRRTIEKHTKKKRRVGGGVAIKGRGGPKEEEYVT